MSGEDIVIHIILSVLLAIAILGMFLNIVDILRQSKQNKRSSEMREALRKINTIASYYDDSAPNRKKLIAEICDLARIALAETKEGGVK